MNGDGFVDQVKLDGAVKVALNKKGEGFRFVRAVAGDDIGGHRAHAGRDRDDEKGFPSCRPGAQMGGPLRRHGTHHRHGPEERGQGRRCRGRASRSRSARATSSCGSRASALRSPPPIPSMSRYRTCPPGEALYFRANSVDEITNDTVTFHPVITYEQVCTPDASGTGSTCRSVSADEAASNAAPRAASSSCTTVQRTFLFSTTVKWPGKCRLTGT